MDSWELGSVLEIRTIEYRNHTNHGVFLRFSTCMCIILFHTDHSHYGTGGMFCMWTSVFISLLVHSKIGLYFTRTPQRTS